MLSHFYSPLIVISLSKECSTRKLSNALYQVNFFGAESFHSHVFGRLCESGFLEKIQGSEST